MPPSLSSLASPLPSPLPSPHSSPPFTPHPSLTPRPHSSRPALTPRPSLLALARQPSPLHSARSLLTPHPSLLARHSSPPLKQEAYLELPRAEMEKVVAGLGVSVEELTKRIEDLARLH